MRILKHIIFISILSGVFVLIYRQSDEKGFRRWWMSFKPAVLTAAIAAGLIPFNTEVIESPGNNNSVYQERLLSDQEFNLFEDSDQRVIFAKNSGEAEAFPVTPINKSGQNRNGLVGTGNEKGNPDDDPSNSNTPFSDFKENRIRINQTPDLLINPTTQLTRISEASKNALKTRGGNERFWKFGPGSKARGLARGNRRKARNSNIFADGFVLQQTYCHYHKSDPPLSCKTIVKVLDSPFQGNGDNPPPEDASNSNFGLSKYKGGPSPFKNFDYDNENHSRENVNFSNQRRMSHSYDGHAKNCFGIQENRNKQSLQKFEKVVRDYIESTETEKTNVSYRYETPTYHYKKPNEDLIITVNATNNEFISVRNATDFQLEKFEIDGNLGYDSRPSMQLRLRGPK